MNQKITTSYRLSLLFILVVALLLRIMYLGVDSLNFDEGANWFTANILSIPDMIQGKYTYVGSVPFFYIFTHVFNRTLQEFTLRLPSALSGVLVIYLWYVLFDRFGRKKTTIPTLLFLAVSPALVYYSREFKYYMPGLLFQSASVLFYFTAVLSKKKNSISLIFCVFFSVLAVFTSFSGIFILFYILISLTFLHKEIRRRYIFSMYIPLCIASLAMSIWTIYFYWSPYGTIAFGNYIAHENIYKIQSMFQSIYDIFLFHPVWISPIKSTAQPYIAIGIGIIFIWILRRLRIPIQGTDMRDILKYENPFFLKELILLLTTVFFGSFLFSLIFFDIMSIKMLLILVMPLAYIISMIFNSYPIKSTFETLWNPYVVIIVLCIMIDFYHIFSEKYDFRELYTLAASSVAHTSCATIVTSQDAAEGLVLFYNKKLGKKPLTIQSIKPISTLSSVQSETQNGRRIGEIKNSSCEYIIFFRYYSNWSSKFISFRDFEEVLTQYSLTAYGQQGKNKNELSVEVYKKNHHDTTIIK